MRKCRVWVKTAIGVLAMVACAASLVAAQEVALSNRALKNTYLKTRSDIFQLLTSWQNIFSSTAITCPGASGTCTARIEVSVQLNPSIQPSGFDAFVECRVIRSGGVISPITAHPGEVRLSVRSGGTFQWIFTGVPLGTHAITVQCSRPVSPVIHAWKRTLTIDVYKP